MFFPIQALLSLTLVAALVAASPIQNGLLQRQSCSNVHLFFARGTTEVATLGTVVGPPLRTALGSALGGKSLAFEGIDYPATVAEFLVGGDKAGSKTMADRVTSVADQCPNAKIVMSGYSLPGVLQDRRETFCNTGYLIRTGQSVILAPHLTYRTHTPEAAKFIASMV